MDNKPLKTIPTIGCVLSQFQQADTDQVWQRTDKSIAINEVINYDHPEKAIIAILKRFISLASSPEAILIAVQDEINTMLKQLNPYSPINPNPKPDKNLAEVKVGGTE